MDNKKIKKTIAMDGSDYDLMIMPSQLSLGVVQTKSSRDNISGWHVHSRRIMKTNASGRRDKVVEHIKPRIKPDNVSLYYGQKSRNGTDYVQTIQHVRILL